MNNNYLNIWHLNSMWSLLGSISSGDKFSIKGNLLTIEKNHPLFGKLLRDSINMNVDKRPYMDTVLKRLKKISFTHDHK